MSLPDYKCKAGTVRAEIAAGIPASNSYASGTGYKKYSLHSCLITHKIVESAGYVEILVRSSKHIHLFEEKHFTQAVRFIIRLGVPCRTLSGLHR